MQISSPTARPFAALVPLAALCSKYSGGRPAVISAAEPSTAQVFCGEGDLARCKFPVNNSKNSEKRACVLLLFNGGPRRGNRRF